MGADGGLGKLAQQRNQRSNRTLKLIRLTEIPALKDLFDLPVEPERRLIQQSPIVTGSMVLEKFIGVLA